MPVDAKNKYVPKWCSKKPWYLLSSPNIARPTNGPRSFRSQKPPTTATAVNNGAVRMSAPASYGTVLIV